MSDYSPDPAALPTGIPFIRQLSERDLSLRIPVDYVTAPGISLTPACFAHRKYEDAPAAKCFSNLLAVGFDRFEIDLYWDVTRKLWSLCPVQLGDASAPKSNASTASPSTALRANDGKAVYAVLRDTQLQERHPTVTTRSLSIPSSPSSTADSSSASSSITTTVSPTSATSATAPSTSSTLSSGTLIRIGPYSCTSSINLELFTKVLSGHLHSTQTNLNATVKYFLLNMHTAAPASNPTGSGLAPPSGDLPQGTAILSSILSLQVSQYLYTPDNLLSERADLNVTTSWYGNLQKFQPDPSYLQVFKSGGHYATADGWPSESFVEMDLLKRLFVGYGQVDPQLQGYNFSADAPTIFKQGYLHRKAPTTLNRAGQIENGCFYRPGVYSIGSVNNSWATSAAFVPLGGQILPLDPILDGASDLTACGISPILNETLKNMTADEDFSPYKDYVQNTIWSWAPNQPQNASRSDDDNPSTHHRCAVLNATSGYWQTENCPQSHYSACRLPGQTYEWVISRFPTSYQKANLPCPDGTEFFVPRTALENKYLVNKWREVVANENLNDPLLWVNFNDLDAATCWVIGQSTTCPYLKGQSHEREVLVPTIAGIVVFVLAALTIFVKCAANRQQSKRRRRRGDDGWDYEGVPS